jgi:hypothetical protein
MRHPRVRDPRLVRVAAGVALALLALVLLVQALVALAVREVTDDYVRRFMRGTVQLLQHELAAAGRRRRRAQRVRELDEQFAYPVALGARGRLLRCRAGPAGRRRDAGDRA